MPLNWSALRVWNGSRETAFEELCCQLAAGECPAVGARFVRKGTPDAGVECFWELPNGSEHGWQAKFFDGPPTPKQWSEVDESVKTALDKHPRLIKYIVCLPVDRSDSRLTGHKTFLARWNERVAKWKRWASAKSMVVEFEYWGNHELESRLSREENRGRHWYWFNAEQLTTEWFKRQLDVAIKNAGDRYTPVLNIELPLAQTFDALGRTPAFHARLGKLYEALREAIQRVPRECEFAQIQTAVTGVKATAARLLQTLDNLLRPLDEEPQIASARLIPWNDIQGQAKTLTTQASELRESVQECVVEQRRLVANTDATKSESRSRIENLEAVSASALAAYVSASHLADFCESAEAKVANQPELLLIGSAGQGKTHLLCDIAERDMAAGRPRLLLHGSHFTDAEPWSQIITMLGLKQTVEEFIGALEAMGQVCGCRVLILIDALNEGDGRPLWTKHLPGMLTRLARTPWIGIAVSVRDSYEEVVIPNGLVPDRLTRVVHPGFREHEYDAVSRFFNHYHIQPTAPLLVPEFSNPLFLRLFCKSIRDLGLNQVPAGLRGMTAIFNTFLDAVNRRLSDPSRMDYDEKSNPVRKATAAVVQLIADKGDYWVPRDEAIAAVNAILPTNGYDQSLFRNLVTEGLLSESRWSTGEELREVVHFTYERFADHFLAAHLLEKHLDPKDPKKAFHSRARIGKLLKDEQACWRYAGLIEALSVQLPERVKKELVELAPQVKQFHRAKRAFIQSLIWRDSKAFRKATFDYLESIWRFKPEHDGVLDAMITVAPVTGHPLNANKLHDILIKRSMPDRDAWWSVFLYTQWDTGGAMNRLIDWTWADSDKSALSDEVVMLTGTVLAWFLTSSHRHLRDRSTKALIRLFEARLRLIPQLLTKFREVDDPYVTERLLAVAYGSAMRATNTLGLKELAGTVAEQVFSSERASPNILTQDYGRCLIELARCRSVIDPDAFPESTPPYKSQWPNIKIPTEKELAAWGQFQEKASEEEKAQHAIYWEITDRHLFSDFAKHVGDFEDWTSVRLGTDSRTMKERYDAFLGRLSKTQRKAFDQYRATFGGATLCRGLSAEEQLERFECSFTAADLDRVVSAVTENFEKKVAKDHALADEFRTSIKHYVEHPEHYRVEHRFDGDAARRWMVQRVIDLGWTRERFGEFDAMIRRRYNYFPDRPRGERIGEKYQWIAYRELLARLADNFHLRTDRYGNDKLKVYAGPWDIGSGRERDIDPSIAVRSTRSERTHAATCWWSPTVYSDWSKIPDDLDWLKTAADLPAPEQLLTVRRPQCDSVWYVLDTYINWHQPARLGWKDYDHPHRNLYYIVRAYLVHKQDAARFFKWAKKQHFMDHRMPDTGDVYDVSLGEFYWAPAFKAWQAEARSSWRGRDSDSLPNEVLLTTLNYLHESSGLDRSVDDSLRIRIPTPELAVGVDLRWNGIEGQFSDSQGKLAALDPSVFETGPGALVVRADLLTRYLADNNLELIWTLLGEKQFIGGGQGPSDLGWHEVSGAYRLTETGVSGSLLTEHRTFCRSRRKPRGRR